MSLLDEITGGSNQNAQNAEEEALNAYQGITPPSVAQLTLPELEQYVQAGTLTAAQAQAALIDPSTEAYKSIQLDPTAMQAEYQTLADLSEVANTGGADAEAKLAEQQATDTANATLQGQRGAIEQQAEARGVAPGLAQMASEEQAAGEDANALFSGEQTAAAAEEARQLSALADVGTLGGNIVSQTYAPQAASAAATNAINQFNAANQQQTNLTNTANEQAANTYNTTEANTIAGENTQENNAKTIYNTTQAPLNAYQAALQKAAGTTTAANDLAQQQTAAGQQSAGLFSGILGSAAQLGAGALESNATNNLAGAIAAADGGEVVSMEDGGIIPGKPKVAGDSQLNDIIPGEVGPNGPKIRVSPGEVILPRSVAANPHKIPQFLKTLPRYNPALKNPNTVHPEDIGRVLQALGHLRRGI